MPTVSVLIAARNEVKFSTKSFLASLEQLRNPNEKIEFLIIDDRKWGIQTGEIIISLVWRGIIK